jgi:hypothetical protein
MVFAKSKESDFYLRAFQFSFSPPAAAGRGGRCEDTSRSGKGLPPSALLLVPRTGKPCFYLEGIVYLPVINRHAIMGANVNTLSKKGRERYAF